MVRIRAPELPPHLPWLNTANPLSLKQLRDRIVLLDFWTYGCINCLHILPDLKYLEQTYPDCLTIIGVHSAKFDHEKELANIQQAVWRYGIHHPVLVDNDFQVWQQYVVRAWPTLILIAPAGYIVDRVSGEGHRERLEQQIRQLLRDYPNLSCTQSHDAIETHPSESRNVIKNQSNLHPSESVSESMPEPIITSAIAFPGKVIADQITDNLFIADSGHHRIVQTTLKGELKAVIGLGIAGHAGGDFDNAQFNSPQGMTFDAAAQILYVADTGNHVIRQIDLRSQRVETIAGTTRQSRIIYPHGGKALATDLNSPWDLVKVDRYLFIAMSGSHQIWQLDLPTHRIATFAGTGAEACFDAAITTAAFAQPSGIAADRSQLSHGTQLFVADSEGSSIRVLDLSPIAAANWLEARSPDTEMFAADNFDITRIQVKTLCGSGDLFSFGDVDGQGEAVRLQHCLGIAYDTNSTNGTDNLWIADTYNHKIKRVNTRTGVCQTILGNGSAKLEDGPAQQASFSEPSGLSITAQSLYIADTNNHAIRVVDRSTLAVRTLRIPGLCAPTLCFPAETRNKIESPLIKSPL